MPKLLKMIVLDLKGGSRNERSKISIEFDSPSDKKDCAAQLCEQLLQATECIETSVEYTVAYTKGELLKPITNIYKIIEKKA